MKIQHSWIFLVFWGNIALISAQTAIPFVKVSCLHKDHSLCSDSSVLKIYVRRFERECLKKKGTFSINSSCDKAQFYASYCGIPDYHFQIYYSPQKFTLQKAKKLCHQTILGAHTLQWITIK